MTDYKAAFEDMESRLAKKRPDIIAMKNILDDNPSWHATFRAGVIKGWKLHRDYKEGTE